MLSLPALPAGYHLLSKIDFNDKKLRLYIGMLSIGIALLMLIPASFIIPLSTLFKFNSLSSFLLRFVVALAGVIAYFCLRELLRGLLSKRLSNVKPQFVFGKGLLNMHSNAYFCRTHYFVLTLLPILLLALALCILSCVVPRSWFWVVYIVQVINFSGFAEALYFARRLRPFPYNILLRLDEDAVLVYAQTV